MKRHDDGQVNPSPPDALRYLEALATLAVGAMHIQQYADFIADNEPQPERGPRRNPQAPVCLA